MQGYPVAEAARVLDVPDRHGEEPLRPRPSQTPAAAHSSARRTPGIATATERGKEPDAGDIRPTGSGTTGCRAERSSCCEGRRWASVTSTTDTAAAPGRRGDLRPHRRSAPSVPHRGCASASRRLRALRRRPRLPGGDPRPARHPARARRGCPTMSPAASTPPSPPRPFSTPPRPTRDRGAVSRADDSRTAERAAHVSRETSPPHGPPRRHARAPPPARAARTARGAAPTAGSPSSAPSSPPPPWASASVLVQSLPADGGDRRHRAGAPAAASARARLLRRHGSRTGSTALLAEPGHGQSSRPRSDRPSDSGVHRHQSTRNTVCRRPDGARLHPEGHRPHRRRPLAAEQGTYEGSDAYLVVLPAPLRQHAASRPMSSTPPAWTSAPAPAGEVF